MEIRSGQARGGYLRLENPIWATHTSAGSWVGRPRPPTEVSDRNEMLSNEKAMKAV